MKKQVIIDGAMMKDKKSTHRHLAKQLGFSNNYKGSIEELEEQLASLRTPMEIIWLRHEMIFDQMEDYGDELFQTMVDAAEENEMLDVFIAQSIFE